MLDRPFVVIGAGVIGLSCAYFLRRAGANVVVLERRAVGAGASARNAGWIVPSLGVPLPAPGRISFALGSVFRPNSPFHLDARAAPSMIGWLLTFARRCNARDHLRGLHELGALAEPTMDLFDEMTADGVRFTMSANGLLFAFRSQAAAYAEIAALSPMREHGYAIADEPLGYDEVHECAPILSDAVLAGVLVRGERHVDPLALLAGLAERSRALGVQISEGAEVSGFVVENRRVVAVRTGSGPVDVSGVLVAAGAWSGALSRGLGVQLPVRAGKGYSFSVDVKGPPPAQATYLAEVMVGCTPFDGHLRLAGTMDLSAVDDIANPRRIAAIRRSATAYLRGISWETMRDEWMGMRPITPDGLPVLGRLGDLMNAYVASGHQMLGVTLAPATAQAMSKLITGSEVPVLDAFSPNRFA